MSDLAKRIAKRYQLSEEEYEKYAKEVKRVNLIVQNLRLRLRQVHPFYGTALLMLHDTVPTTKCKTLATNGLIIMYNPEYTSRQTQGMLNFSMMHELLHVLLGHTKTKKSGDPFLWNLAEDAVINWELYKMASALGTQDKLNLKLVPNCVLLKANDIPYDIGQATSAMLYTTAEVKNLNCEEYALELVKRISSITLNRLDDLGEGVNTEVDGMDIPEDSMAEILDTCRKNNVTGKLYRLNYRDGSYERLEPDSQQANPTQIFGSLADIIENDESSETGLNPQANLNQIFGSLADIIENDESSETGLNQKELDEIQKEICNIISRARDEALRQRSSVSGAKGSLTDWIIDSLKPSRVKWDTYLKRYLTAHEGSDTSWVTPERKYLCHGYILPGAGEEEHLGNVWFFIDQSGSIRTEELQFFLEQAYTICKNFNCELNIAYWDTEVSEPYLEIADPKQVVDAKPTSTGGTDIRCVFRYIRNNKKLFNDSVIIICTDGFCGYEQNLEAWIRRMTIIALSDSSSGDITELASNGKLVDL